MQKLRVVISLAIVLTGVIIARGPARTAKAPNDSPRDRLIESVRKQPPRTDYHIRFQDRSEARRFRTAPAPPATTQSVAVDPPPPSPGIPVGVTWLDMQHPQSQGKQIARNPGDDYVHMVWSSIQAFDPDDHWDQSEVRYNSYRHSTGTLVPGFGGNMASLATIARGQYGNVDVADDGAARLSLSQLEDLSWPRVPFAYWVVDPGLTIQVFESMYPAGHCGTVLWPKQAVQQRPATEDLRHMLARGGAGCDDTRIYYWRFENGIWSGPALIDSSFSMGHVIAADNNSEKIAIVMHDIDEPGFNGANNIFYYESTTSGLGWVSGSELGPSFKQALTNYTDTSNGPQAWQQIDAVYDNAGRLHVVWDEQQVANATTNAGIRHWNDERNTIRPVMLAVYPNPHLTLRLNVSGLSIGIGDGMTTCSGETNLDMVYVTYTKFGGTSPAEQADVAGPAGSETHPNGELYLSSSNTGGNTWAPPQNLSNTKTPNCNPQFADSVCRSEDWATIAKHVSNMEIVYISDRDAGPAPQGIGTYQPDDVMYLRIPGGGVNMQYICPLIAPGFATTITSDPECEYHAEPGTVKNDELLQILNLGNAPLTGTIEVLPGSPWLTIAGAGAFSIPAGGADLSYIPVMDATGLAEGLYSATIRITHNDSTDPSPWDIPIIFIVVSEFHCPQGAVLSTGVE